MATMTFEYNVTHDGGQTWHAARKTFTGIREPFIESKPGEPHRVSFLADVCEESDAVGLG